MTGLATTQKPQDEATQHCGGTGEIRNPGATAFDSRCPCPGCPDCQPQDEEER